MDFVEFYGNNKDWINLLIGLGVSGLLFFVTYWKTVGARKERANRTHSEVTRILVRNLLSNDRVLTIPEINRILHTKSIENKIKITDLPDEVSFIYALYTKVAEDEILPSENRKELLHKINKYLEEIEKEVPSIIEAEEEPVEGKEMFFEKFEFLLGFISVFIAAISMIFVNFVFAEEITLSSLLTISATLAGIIALITAIYSFMRLKEKQEEPAVSRKSFIQEYRNFEERVFKVLKRLGDIQREFRLAKEGELVSFDFLLTTDSKKFLIEIKWFRRYASKFSIDRLKSIAKTAKDIDKTCLLVLVVNDKKFIASGLSDLKMVWDYIFDERELKDFRNRLIHGVR